LSQLLDDIRDKITGLLSGSPYDVMMLSLLSSGIFILVDFLVDLLVFYPGRSLVYVLNVNLAWVSLWHSLLIVSAFLVFGYAFIVYRNMVKEEADNIDEYISSTIEALDALRYNLYSMRMAIHSSNSTDMTYEEAIDSVEEGLSVSINLIDAYLENNN